MQTNCVLPLPLILSSFFSDCHSSYEKNQACEQEPGGLRGPTPPCLALHILHHCPSLPEPPFASSVTVTLPLHQALHASGSLCLVLHLPYPTTSPAKSRSCFRPPWPFLGKKAFPDLSVQFGQVLPVNFSSTVDVSQDSAH